MHAPNRKPTGENANQSITPINVQYAFLPVIAIVVVSINRPARDCIWPIDGLSPLDIHIPDTFSVAAASAGI
jgi:hypothetical protein